MPDQPRPGVPVRGSTTGRPLMAALDLLGQRWTLRVIWELRADALGFRGRLFTNTICFHWSFHPRHDWGGRRCAAAARCTEPQSRKKTTYATCSHSPY